MPTLESAIKTRANLAFIFEGSYQPLLTIAGLTLVPPRPSCSMNTKTDRTLWVGRLHYSLRPTPSAHFRWWLQRVRALTVLTSTGVLGSEPDYMDPGKPRSIRHLTYPYTASSGGGSTPN